MENSTLSSKVTVLSEAVSKKTEAEEAMTQEAIESALPKGFPLSGSAVMTEASEDAEKALYISSNSGKDRRFHSHNQPCEPLPELWQ